MKDLKNKTEQLTEHISEHVETYVSYTILKATDKAAGVASNGITTLIIGVMGFFALLFAGIGTGYYLGQRLENMLAGFGIVAGFFALIMILFLSLRKSIFTPYFKDLIIKLTYE